MEGKHNESMPQEVDLSQEFITLEVMEFLEKEHQLRKVPVLSINVDLSDIEDKNEFISRARRLKAFLESNNKGQERNVTVRAKREQKQWEVNAFMSGVKFEPID